MAPRFDWMPAMVVLWAAISVLAVVSADKGFLVPTAGFYDEFGDDVALPVEKGYLLMTFENKDCAERWSPPVYLVDGKGEDLEYLCDEYGKPEYDFPIFIIENFTYDRFCLRFKDHVDPANCILTPTTLCSPTSEACLESPACPDNTFCTKVTDNIGRIITKPCAATLEGDTCTPRQQASANWQYSYGHCSTAGSNDAISLCQRYKEDYNSTFSAIRNPDCNALRLTGRRDAGYVYANGKRHVFHDLIAVTHEEKVMGVWCPPTTSGYKLVWACVIRDLAVEDDFGMRQKIVKDDISGICDPWINFTIPDSIINQSAVYKLVCKTKTEPIFKLSNYLVVFGAGKLILSGNTYDPTTGNYQRGAGISAVLDQVPPLGFTLTKYTWKHLKTNYTYQGSSFTPDPVLPTPLGDYEIKATLTYKSCTPHSILSREITRTALIREPPIELIEEKTAFLDQYGDDIGVPIEGGTWVIVCKAWDCKPGDEYQLIDEMNTTFKSACDSKTKQAAFHIIIGKKTMTSYRCSNGASISNKSVSIDFQLCSPLSQTCINSPDDCPLPLFCYRNRHESIDDVTPCRPMKATHDSCQASKQPYFFCHFQNNGCLTLEKSFLEQYKFTWAAYSNAQKRCTPYTGKDQDKPYTFKNAKNETTRLEVNGVIAIYNQPIAVTKDKNSITIHCPVDTLTNKHQLIFEIRGAGGTIEHNMTVAEACDGSATFQIPEALFAKGSQIYKLICRFDKSVTRVKLTNYLVIFAGTLTVKGSNHDEGAKIIAGSGIVTASFSPVPSPEIKLTYNWTRSEGTWTKEGPALNASQPGGYMVEAKLTFKSCAPHMTISHVFKHSSTIQVITTAAPETTSSGTKKFKRFFIQGVASLFTTTVAALFLPH